MYHFSPKKRNSRWLTGAPQSFFYPASTSTLLMLVCHLFIHSFIHSLNASFRTWAISLWHEALIWGKYAAYILSGWMYSILFFHQSFLSPFSCLLPHSFLKNWREVLLDLVTDRLALFFNSSLLLREWSLENQTLIALAHFAFYRDSHSTAGNSCVLFPTFLLFYFVSSCENELLFYPRVLEWLQFNSCWKSAN